MFIFAMLIMISIVLYIYYKVAILKTKDKLSQKYINAKSRIFLGTFVIFFGINQYIAYQTKLILFISIVFLFLGVIQAIDGFKEAKHYRNEWKRLNPES
ncbi:YtpI family protein [Pseudogracilibacillus sp. SO30301A]|uniref:YtpI family protein n=1 Tax=Pseudogracilibacillus sp. SO30301A TaxID=3098291 RepID=UPI00300DFA7C